MRQSYRDLKVSVQRNNKCIHTSVSNVVTDHQKGPSFTAATVSSLCTTSLDCLKSVAEDSCKQDRQCAYEQH